MSRKSKITISREKLELLSDCPVDIFDKIEADDELFEKISAAENKDLNDGSIMLVLCAVL